MKVAGFSCSSGPSPRFLEVVSSSAPARIFRPAKVFARMVSMARHFHHYTFTPDRNNQVSWTVDTLRNRLQQLTGLAVGVAEAQPGFKVTLHAEPDVARLFLQLVKPHFALRPV